MLLTCPRCAYRTERDLFAGEIVECRWCAHSYDPGGRADASPAPPVEALIQPTPPRPKGRWPKSSAAFVLFCLAIVFVMPQCSYWQDVQNKANSPPGTILAPQGDVLKVVFRPDGQRLASAGGIYKGRGKWTTGEIAIWDPASGRCLLTFPGHPEGVKDLDYSPDGRRLASISSDGLKVWDAETGNLLSSAPPRPQEQMWRAAFQPRGTWLATLSEIGHLPKGRGRMAIKFWDAQAASDAEKRTPLFSYSFEAGTSRRTGWELPRLTFSPDGTGLACGNDHAVWIWDVNSEASAGRSQPALVLQGHTGPVCDQVFSPDGKKLATASDDETVRIWDAKTGQELQAFDSPRDGMPGYRALGCLSYSPDGKYLAGGKAQNLAIYDTATGELTHYLRWHGWTIESLAYSPDGSVLATGSRDHYIKLWDLAALARWTPEGKHEEPGR